MANAMKRKDSFIQFFAMTGILLLSIRSLGQKYRIHDLQEDTLALKQEQETLIDRINNIKRALRHEASLEPTGLFASRLRLLFGEENWIFGPIFVSFFFIFHFLKKNLWDFPFVSSLICSRGLGFMLFVFFFFFVL